MHRMIMYIDHIPIIIHMFPKVGGPNWTQQRMVQKKYYI